MGYAIRISKRAFKELERLPVKESAKISLAIDALAENPRPAGCKKLKGEEDISGEFVSEIIGLSI